MITDTALAAERRASPEELRYHSRYGIGCHPDGAPGADGRADRAARLRPAIEELVMSSLESIYSGYVATAPGRTYTSAWID